MEGIIKLVTPKDIDAYIATLKPDQQKHMKEIYGLPGRFTPIVIGSELEDLLGQLLVARVLDTPKHAKCVMRLGMTQKIEMCEALGLIEDTAVKVLERVYKVRNHFAHKKNPSYSDEQPRTAIRELLTLLVDSLGQGMGVDPANIEKSKRIGLAEIDADENHARIVLISLYQLVKSFLLDNLAHTTRVDEPWKNGKFVKTQNAK